MKLYDNDVYREKFMEIVYGVLSSDETNDRANQIIDAFDNAPQVETEDLLANDPLTLEQLREMDGEPVWVCTPEGSGGMWALVDLEYERCRTAKGGAVIFDSYGKNWVAYSPRPEKQSC